VPNLGGEDTPYIPPATPEEIAQNRANNPGPGAFGQRMRDLAMQGPAYQGVNWDDVKAARLRAMMSRGTMNNAIGGIRQMAMGQGPSVAAVQQQAGQDAALRSMLGKPMLPGSISPMYGVASQAAQQRAQEIGQAQQSEAQGVGQSRGLSLQDLQQGMQARHGATENTIAQGQQNLERELKLQGLSLSGYQQESGLANELANIQSGFYADEIARQNAQLGAYIGAGSSLMGGIANYGGGDGGGGGGEGLTYDSKAGIYRGNPYG
jgi:hypothetical protein